MFMPALLQAQDAAASAEPNLEEWIKVRPQWGAFKMAIPDLVTPSGADELSAELAQVLRDDLDLSGEIAVIEPRVYFSVPPPIRGQGTDFGPWSLIGAQGVISGYYTPLEGDKIQLDMRFFRVAGSELVLGKRYTGTKSNMRRMVHRFADEVLEAVTGKRGGFESYITFVSDKTGRREVYLMDSDGQGVKKVTSNNTLNLSPSFSPDGSKLLFTSYKERNPDLYLMDLSGRGIKLSSHPGPNLGGEFSRDGARVALSRLSSTGNMDLYIIGPSGGEPRRITNHPAADLSPTWSPNGSLIAFVSDRSGTPQVYLLDGPESDSNRPVRVSNGAYCTSPAFSPDGRYIAYAGRRSGTFDIFIVDLEAGSGKAVRSLTSMRGNEEDPTWSPDGRLVAFSSNNRGNYDIYVMNVYGGKPQRITDSGSKEISPSWGPLRNE